MPSPRTRLARLRKRYEQQAGELAQVGFILKGTVSRRFLTCGSPGCRCHAEPPRWHGPYWQWTSKVRGKTVSRMLSEEEARRYQEWISNGRRFEKIVKQIYDIASQADELLRTHERSSQAAEGSSPARRPRTSAARR